MTKTLKRTILTALIFISALLMILSTLFIPNAEASAYIVWGADRYENYGYSGNDTVSFIYGAEVEGESVNVLNYKMNITSNYINTHHAGFDSTGYPTLTLYPDYKNANWLYGRTLTVYRQNEDGTATPLAGYLIGDWGGATFIYKKSMATNGAIDEADTVDIDIRAFMNAEAGEDIIDEETAATIYDGESVNTHTDKNNGTLLYCKKVDYSYNMQLREYEIKLTVPSSFSKYYVKFSYAVAVHEPFTGYYAFVSVNSSAHSVYDRLKRKKEAGTLESTFNENQLVYANAILENKVVNDITIEYLEQIGSTPYAVKKTKIIEGVAYDGTTGATTLEILSHLSNEEKHTMQSVIYDFTRNEANETYTAIYDKSVWITGVTADGNKLNYFLDLNKSYADYYGSLKGDGVFSEDLYNHIFYQKIYRAYPEIDKQMLTPEEVYGYFGYVVIPKTNSLNQLWYEMFDNQTNFGGVINGFEYEELLSVDAYDKLLGEYQYNWLERIWNFGAGSITGYDAKHFIIFADSTTTQGIISDGGANGGGQIGDTAGTVGGWVGDFFGAIFNTGAPSWVNGLIVIVLIAAVIFVIIKVRGIGKGGGGSKRRKRK